MQEYLKLFFTDEVIAHLKAMVQEAFNYFQSCMHTLESLKEELLSIMYNNEPVRPASRIKQLRVDRMQSQVMFNKPLKIRARTSC